MSTFEAYIIETVIVKRDIAAGGTLALPLVVTTWTHVLRFLIHIIVRNDTSGQAVVLLFVAFVSTNTVEFD